MGVTTLVFPMRELTPPGVTHQVQTCALRYGWMERALCQGHWIHCVLLGLAYPNHCSVLLFNGFSPAEWLLNILSQVGWPHLLWSKHAGSECSQGACTLVRPSPQLAYCGNERSKLQEVCAAALLQGGILGRESRTETRLPGLPAACGNGEAQ